MWLVEEIDFSVWLEDQLVSRGWRPIDLANAAGLPNATVTRILNGDRRAGPDAANAIAKGLNLPAEMIFRAAGLLPPEPTQEENLTFQQVLSIMRQMSPDERQEILDYALFRLRRKESKE